MSKHAAGVIVIGQSPRPVLMDELFRNSPNGQVIRQVGVLDGLSRREISAAEPKDGGDALFARLPDGVEVSLSKQLVSERVDHCLKLLESEGTSLALLCCTGTFPRFEGSIPLIEASRILAGLVDAILPEGRLGVLAPLPEQIPNMQAKWKRESVNVVASSVAPGGFEAAFTKATRDLKMKGAQVIVMDCMAYTAAEKEYVRSIFDGPVVLAVSAVGRVMDELLA